MTALRNTPVTLIQNAAPFAIRAERASDVVAREALLDACFGENRHLRTCQRLRDGRAPAEGLALSAVRQRRRRASAGARSAGGGSVMPRAWYRSRADAPRADSRQGARPWRGGSAGR